MRQEFDADYTPAYHEPQFSFRDQLRRVLLVWATAAAVVVVAKLISQFGASAGFNGLG